MNFNKYTQIQKYELLFLRNILGIGEKKDIFTKFKFCEKQAITTYSQVSDSSFQLLLLKNIYLWNIFLYTGSEKVEMVGESHAYVPSRCKRSEKWKYV